MIPKILSGNFLRIFFSSLILSALFIDNDLNNNQALANKKIIPADNEDIVLYQGIGATYLCLASKQGVEFEKALVIAAQTYVNVMEGKHGGLVKDLGETKLDKEKLFRGATDQIIVASTVFCPEEVPEDITKQVNESLKKNKNSKEEKEIKRNKRNKKK